MESCPLLRDPRLREERPLARVPRATDLTRLRIGHCLFRAVEGDAPQRLEALDQGVGPLRGDSHGGDQLVAPPGVGVGAGILDRVLGALMPMSMSVRPLSANVGSPGTAALYGWGRTWARGGDGASRDPVGADQGAVQAQQDAMRLTRLVHTRLAPSPLFSASGGHRTPLRPPVLCDPEQLGEALGQLRELERTR